MGRASRPLSARLLHEMDGRTDRQSEHGMEGPRPVGHGQHARAVPHGDGQRDDEQSDALPAAPESDSEVTFQALGFRLWKTSPEALQLHSFGTIHGTTYA